VQATVKPDDSAGLLAYRLLDEIAERYLDLVDSLDEEIDELEDKVESQPADATRARISSLRHDLLHIRRTLSPMRDAVRRVIDGTVEVEEGPEVFTHDVEVALNAAYDKFLRASDGLDLARDKDRERPEGSNEAPHRDRVAAPAPRVHRRALGAELQRHPGAALGPRLRLRVGAHRRHDGVAAVVVPPQELGLIRCLRSTGSTNGERVGLAAGHKGVPIEWIDVDPNDRAPVEELSGQSLVPVLVAGDEVLADSPRILDWLEERFPEPSLLPPDPARAAEVTIFADWFNRV